MPATYTMDSSGRSTTSSYAKTVKQLDAEEKAAKDQYNRTLDTIRAAPYTKAEADAAKNYAASELNRTLAGIDARRASLKKSSKDNTPYVYKKKDLPPTPKTAATVKPNLGDTIIREVPPTKPVVHTSQVKPDLGDDPKRTSSPPPQETDATPDNTKQPVIYSPQQSLPPKTNSQVHPITGGDVPKPTPTGDSSGTDGNGGYKGGKSVIMNIPPKSKEGLYDSSVTPFESDPAHKAAIRDAQAYLDDTIKKKYPYATLEKVADNEKDSINLNYRNFKFATASAENALEIYNAIQETTEVLGSPPDPKTNSLQAAVWGASALGSIITQLSSQEPGLSDLADLAGISDVVEKSLAKQDAYKEQLKTSDFKYLLNPGAASGLSKGTVNTWIISDINKQIKNTANNPYLDEKYKQYYIQYLNQIKELNKNYEKTLPAFYGK